MSHMHVQDCGYIHYQYDTSIATAQAAVDRNPVSKHFLCDKQSCPDVNDYLVNHISWLSESLFSVIKDIKS
jgi:hypothetical protein